MEKQKISLKTKLGSFLVLENKVQIIPEVFIPDRREIFLAIKAKGKMWKKKVMDVEGLATHWPTEKRISKEEKCT